LQEVVLEVENGLRVLMKVLQEGLLRLARVLLNLVVEMEVTAVLALATLEELVEEVQVDILVQVVQVVLIMLQALPLLVVEEEVAEVMLELEIMLPVLEEELVF
jgi:hypothetical protein